MQNVMWRMSETPGEIQWSGRPLGADNEEILGALGVTAKELEELAALGVC